MINKREQMINRIFIQLLKGGTKNLSVSGIARLVNYCKSISGNYTLNIEIVEQKLKVKLL